MADATPPGPRQGVRLAASLNVFNRNWGGCGGAHGGGAGAGAAHGWQPRITLLALALPAAPVAVMLTEGLSAAWLVPPVLLPAAPPALRADRARLAYACAVLGAVLLAYSAAGFREGAWIFLPPALLLLCATFTDPRAYGARATLAAALAGLVAVVPALVFCGAVMALAGLAF